MQENSVRDVGDATRVVCVWMDINDIFFKIVSMIIANNFRNKFESNNQ